MSVWGSVHMNVNAQRHSLNCIPHGTGVINNCEQLGVGSGNRTQILCKSSIHF